MWIREYQHTTFIITYLRKVIKVHIIITILTQTKRVENNLTTVIFRRHTERMIDRRLYDNFLSWLCKHIHNEANAFNNTRNKAYPLWFYLPTMM